MTEIGPLTRPKDFSVEVRVRNNWLLHRLQASEFESGAALERAAGIAAGGVSELLTMRTPAKTKKGEWIKAVVAISECLKCMPEDIIPPHYRDAPLQNTRLEFKANAEELCDIAASLRSLGTSPEDSAIAADVRVAVGQLLTLLPPREERVLRLRFGFFGAERTREEVGEMFGVTPARIKQIEEKAIRKLKHPGRSKRLNLALGEA